MVLVMFLLIDFGYEPRVAITGDEAKQYGIKKKFYVDDDKAGAFITKKRNQAILDSNKSIIIKNKLGEALPKQTSTKKQINVLGRIKKITRPIDRRAEKALSQSNRAFNLLKNSRSLLK